MANNKKAKGAWKVSKVLCETMLEEWYEFRVYRGKQLVETFTDPNEAGAFVKEHKAA